ncbi:MAG: hypothetical protein ACLFTH_00285 [Candidatus Woesearchaeota archaeon]
MKSFPTIKTVLMVEDFLIRNSFDLFSKAAIIRGLDGKINNNNLTTILNYLEASNKIIQGEKGIQWIQSSNPKLKKFIREGLEV